MSSTKRKNQEEDGFRVAGGNKTLMFLVMYV